MPKCLILVDNSNVFIEGAKFSAHRKGVRRQVLDKRDPQDPSWRLDFGKLLDFFAEGRGIIDAILVGSTPPSSDTIWTAARAKGFRVLTHARSYSGEKAVDTEIVAQGTEIICEQQEPGVVVLASGDRDFIPLVKLAKRKGWTVEMAAFSNAFQHDGEMALAVDRVRQLDSEFDRIGRHDFEWPAVTSAPTPSSEP